MTSTTQPTGFDQHCIVELMGHVRMAGRVTEQAIGGTTLLRLDIPAVKDVPGFTTYFGGSAIYKMTPVDEDTAKIAAASFSIPHPVEEWSIKRHLAGLLKSGNGDGQKVVDVKHLWVEESDDEPQPANEGELPF